MEIALGGRRLLLVVACLGFSWAAAGCCSTPCEPPPAPEIRVHGMFRAASSPFPSSAVLDLRGVSGAEQSVLVVQAFATKLDASKLEEPESHARTLVRPEARWRSVSRAVDWQLGDPLSSLVRVSTKGKDGSLSLILQQVGVDHPTTADPLIWQKDTQLPGDQITDAQATGTFYSSGVSLYDVSVTYDAKPRAIRVYAAPAGTPGFPNPSDLVYIAPTTELPDLDSGTATWTHVGLSGPYDGSASTYWMQLQAVYKDDQGNTVIDAVTGNFTNIQALDPIYLEPIAP